MNTLLLTNFKTAIWPFYIEKSFNCCRLCCRRIWL